MALYDGPFCFGEDGYFHPVDPVEDGNDVVDNDVRLKSVHRDGVWQIETFDRGGAGAMPHNEFYEANHVVLNLEP